MELAQIVPGLFILLCIAVMGLHVLSLPANWIILVLLALWKFLHPAMDMSWWFFLGLAALAGVAEVLEFVIQLRGARKYGASGRGNLGGIIGAIAGAILGAGFLLGVGALPGALLGAWGGCLLVERLNGRDWAEARHAALGAMWGKFFGMTVKIGFGAVILSLAVPPVWGS
ncbi:DUF456 domain-containing protein [Desulfocurvus sp.]|jgi:hypothetical protein|uniref:DUF456 domain-containing protein n=1 Tax=Desulfocurvus sp. TaxID=2871698 RepID=UPI0025BFFE2A|nr:DUF456 domain-containing protein [Desulfocurvus sp.]MCK9240439.1 DUF456 domain-containing protein [Desulfocurvus sp.]